MSPARLQLIARTGHPDFLDLPWEEPLEEWTHERLVEVVRGIHRHVVRFVEYEGRLGPKLYALKELPSSWHGASTGSTARSRPTGRNSTLTSVAPAPR